MEEKLLYTHYQLLHLQNLPFSVGKSLALGVIKNIQVYVRGKASSSLLLLSITISTFAKLYATFAVKRYLITSLWWVASQQPLGADTAPGPARYRSPLLRVSVATLRGSGYSITPPLATHLQFICFSVFRLAFFCPCEDCLLKSYVKHILYSVRAGQSSQNFWFILRNYVWTHN